MTETLPIMTDKDIELAKRKLKYHLWLAVLALVLAAFLGSLAVGAFSVGQGLAQEASDPAQAAQTILIFNIVGGLFIALTVCAMSLTYKLRPGGD